MKYTFSIFIFLMSFFGAFWLSTWSDFQNPYAGLCELVARKIILPDTTVLPWKQHCLQRSTLLKPWSSREALYQDIRNIFSNLKVSHLSLYTPSEVREVWEGVTGATGIKSKFLDGHLVIYEIEVGSPAEAADLQIGDMILSLDEDYPDQESVYRSGGDFLIQRGKQKLSVKLEPQEYQKQRQPEVRRLNSQSVYLKLPSFNREVMNEVDWSTYWKMLKPQDRLIVDLRENSGGNFYAGLRFLSQLLCEGIQIGVLRKKEFSENESADFPLKISDREHIQMLHRHGQLRMKVPTNPECIKHKILVLIDHQTSSVAEMVALAIQETQRGHLMGQQSAGKLLVGLWYKQNQLGSGVEVSIPEAEYISIKGQRIEGEGIEPEFKMAESLSHYQQGSDSYLQAVDAAFLQLLQREN